ncbi:hypothetical protein TWF694_006039 [Orbilia ellipsospora]|uniref:Uncharacterized protein n=1 Tax=Orbilia ellipsospora TaxID=2528407 RepID=A0AAV9WRY6_9PEZI
MLSKILSALLLVTAAVANPVMIPRDVTCPNPTITTYSQYLATETVETTLTTTTITNGWSSLGRITSTKHEKETRTISFQETVYSPTSVTIPLTTVYTTSTAPTYTFPYFIYTSTTTLPGTPPASLCLTKTCTKSIAKTTTYTWTQEWYFVTVWSSTTGHVTTTTTVYFTSTTTTVTSPGPTTALSTTTATAWYTPLAITSSTNWKTAYATPAPVVCT